MLSWAARGGDAVCGKLVNEIVGIADVINDLYAGPRPMLSKSGSCGTTVGAGCDCRPAQHWISSLKARSLSSCLAEASCMLLRTYLASMSALIWHRLRLCGILPACRQHARCTRCRVFVEQRPAGALCRWCSY